MIAFAWFMLCIWPVVGIVLFNKLSLPLAFCVTVLGGYLVLPRFLGIDLPVLPELDKNSIPILTALVMTVVKLGQNNHNTIVLKGWIPREPVIVILLVVMVLGVFGTIYTNQDPLIYGVRFLPGMRLYDAFSFLLDLLIMLLPFLLARRLLATTEAQKVFLQVLVISALIYTLPALWEIRLSPQLHWQIYGYFPGSFVQQIRAEGFRPVVFIGHGLALSIFLCFAILVAAGFYRFSDKKDKIKWAGAALWLLIVLVLSKTLTPLVILVLLLPMVLFLRPRTQLLTAACIAGAVMVFPLLRAADLVPVDRAMAIAENIDPARAQSLGVRFRNEDVLLEKARERPVFGWGGYSRNRVFDEQGSDISITDGGWIVQLGLGGWVRYIGVLGLLCWPVIGLFLSKRNRIDPTCTILVVLMCAKLIDIIPNSGLVPYIWLMAGALAGRLEIKLSDLKQPSDINPIVKSQPTLSRYSRDFDPRDPTRSKNTMAATYSKHSYSRAGNKRHTRKK